MSADGRQDRRNRSRSVERQYPLGLRRYRAAKPSDFLEWSAKRRVDAHAHGRQVNSLLKSCSTTSAGNSAIRRLSPVKLTPIRFGKPSITIVPVGSKVTAAGISIDALVRSRCQPAYAMPAARQSKSVRGSICGSGGQRMTKRSHRLDDHRGPPDARLRRACSEEVPAVTRFRRTCPYELGRAARASA